MANQQSQLYSDTERICDDIIVSMWGRYLGEISLSNV